MDASDTAALQPGRAEVFRMWLKIGLLSFGGPAGQMALMHRLVVEEKQWLSEKQYLNALGFCMLLPGPEAMQLATYSGWRLHGTLGGLVAGLLFVLPGAVVMAVLALVYAVYGDVGLVNDLFVGIKAAVVVIVVQALLRVAKKSLISRVHWGIALVAFVAIFVFNIAFPLVVLCAALAGLVLLTSETSAARSHVALPSLLGQTLRTVLLWMVLWFAPLLLLLLTDQALLLQIGVFFSKLAVVTFGGAYAVLAYLAQAAVGDYGWLTAGAMLDGLGLAETTPGPLILVNEFVGFLAGYKSGGIGMGLLAAVVTLWVTFVPCFLWIFVGAPYLEWISDQPRLRSALSAITAAVVGVVLNVSLWFALHVWFDTVGRVDMGWIHSWVPELASINPVTVALTMLCAVAAFVLRWSLFTVLFSSAVFGIVIGVAMGG